MGIPADYLKKHTKTGIGLYKRSKNSPERQMSA
jgi:hypothetical protein